jgi:hypothetical protein
MSLQHNLKPLGAIAAFAAAVYLVIGNEGAMSSISVAPHAAPAAAHAIDTVDNSRECDPAANVRDACIYL